MTAGADGTRSGPGSGGWARGCLLRVAPPWVIRRVGHSLGYAGMVRRALAQEPDGRDRRAAARGGFSVAEAPPPEVWSLWDLTRQRRGEKSIPSEVAVQRCRGAWDWTGRWNFSMEKNLNVCVGT